MTIPANPDPVAGWVRRHPRIVDTALVALSLVVIGGQLLAAGAFGFAPTASFLLLVTGVVAIVLRRRAPVIAVAGAVVGAAAGAAVGLLVIPIGLLVIGAVVIVHDGWRPWTLGCVAAAVIALTALLGTGSVAGAVFPALVLLVGLLVGTTLSARRRYVRTLVELAETLRVEQDQRAVIAVAEERRRIARDMHDAVAHGLSVVIRLADGSAAVAHDDPAAAGRAAATIAEVGRGALADMRRILTTIDADVPVEPVGDVHRLAEEHRAAGLPVVIERLELDAPHGALSAVVFRIVQESLTNAARYATEATRVVVDVHRSSGRTTIVVEDDGSTVPGTPTADSTGSSRGLLGIRERAALYDGAVDAGPISPHGWRVIVHLTEPRAS